MKTCRACDKTKPLTEFQRYGKSKDGLHSLCKVCKRNYDNEYYWKTPGRKPQITQNREANKNRNRQYVYEYLQDHPCVVCGEQDFRVLQFDHLDPSTKTHTIANIYGYGFRTLVTEIAKCQVLCANCHMRKTAEQLGWYHTLAI